MKSYIIKMANLERKRQNRTINLIASENYCPKTVRKLVGSVLTNKYAEGQPHNRYYSGCRVVDGIEDSAKLGACCLFGANFANVQPHSGSQANAAAYKALSDYLRSTGEIKGRQKMKILALELKAGGHLTHGSKMSFSSDLYNFSYYTLNDDGLVDIQLIEKQIVMDKPHVLLVGFSAYPHIIDLEAIKYVTDKHQIRLMVDMSHFAGLVAAGLHPNPCQYADIVTSTTHKTLRGPRGAIILTNNKDLAKYVDKAVFPYYQGGPMMNVIAAKCECFRLAMMPKFRLYAAKIVRNTLVFGKTLTDLGATVKSGLVHMCLLDTKTSYGLTGREAQERLEFINITTNRNLLPNDTEKPSVTSGLRIGFAAVTTRGCTKRLAEKIAALVHTALSLSNEDFGKKDITDYLRKEAIKITKKLHRV